MNHRACRHPTYASSAVECPQWQSAPTLNICPMDAHRPPLEFLAQYGRNHPDVSSTPAECAIASKCSTPFVDPPKAISTLIAVFKCRFGHNVTWFQYLDATDSLPLRLLFGSRSTCCISRNCFLCRRPW